MNFYQEELERFFAKVDTSGGAGDCQPWDGATTPKGYGMFWLRGQMSSAHRVALMIATQVDGDGLDAGHLCHDRAVERGECEGGNNCQHRRCVNPGHLHWQTRSENLRGRARKTRLGISSVPLTYQDTHQRQGFGMQESPTLIAYSVQSLAEASGVSPHTIRREIEDGSLKARRVRNRIVIPVRAAQEWLGE